MDGEIWQQNDEEKFKSSKYTWQVELLFHSCVNMSIIAGVDQISLIAKHHHTLVIRIKFKHIKTQ